MYVNRQHVLNASGYRHWGHSMVTDKEKLYQSERYRQHQTQPSSSVSALSSPFPNLITAASSHRPSKQQESVSRPTSETPDTAPPSHEDRASNLRRLRRILVERKVQRSKKKITQDQEQEEGKPTQEQEPPIRRQRRKVPLRPSSKRQEMRKAEIKNQEKHIPEYREKKPLMEDNIQEMFTAANLPSSEKEEKEEQFSTAENVKQLIQERDQLSHQVKILKQSQSQYQENERIRKSAGREERRSIREQDHIRKLENRIHHLRNALRQKHQRQRPWHETEEENRRLRQQVEDLRAARKKQLGIDENVKGQVKQWEKRYSALQTRAQQLKDLVKRETKETASWRSMEILAEQQIHDLQTVLSDVWIEANRERRRFETQASQAQHRANKAEEEVRRVKAMTPSTASLSFKEERRREWHKECRIQQLYGAWERLTEVLRERDQMEEDTIRMETELDQLRPQAWSLERGLEDMTAENRNLEERMMFLQNNVEQLSLDLDRTENLLADALDEMRLKQYEHDVSVGEMQVRLQQLSAQHTTDEHVLEEMRRTYDTAVRRADHLRQKLDQAKEKEAGDRNQKTSSTERLRRRIEDLEQQLSQEKTRHDSVLYQEQLTERSMKALQDRLTESERHESELEDDIKGKEKEINDLVKQIEEMEETERQNREIIQNLRNKCRYLEQEIHSKTEGFRIPSTTEETQVSEGMSPRSDEQQHKEMIEYKRKLANQQAIANKQANQIEELKNQLSQQEQSIAEKEKDREDATDAETVARDKVKRLENMLNEQSESHIVEVLEMEESVRLASEEQLREQRKVKELQHALSQAKADAHRNRMKIRDMENKLARRASHQENESKVVEERIQTLERNLQEIQDRSSAREEEYRRIIDDLEHGLCAGQESRIAAQKRLANMENVPSTLMSMGSGLRPERMEPTKEEGVTLVTKTMAPSAPEQIQEKGMFIQ
eukprot:gb/GECH01006501.1/.p1 GENE.gb/GECH01006501.1/~~gb/GECH01006501.1/.p1  ORF type:complete len:950 (+),score=285.30 gb/GECH01006501.1/:1-2850(+)